MTFFDAHTHINFEKYTDDERRALADEISSSDVSYVVDAGDSVESSIQAIRDSESYEWCYATVGIHPHHASSYTDADLEKIRELALSESKVVALGEFGLDFYYGKDNKEAQIDLFRKQIRMANELRMPIMIHTRDADQLTMEILKEEGAFSEDRKSFFSPRRVRAASVEEFSLPGDEDGEGGMLTPDARVQLHCYSGSAELAREYVRLGATISIGGPVTFKNGRKAAEVVQEIPIEYILSETDAPYLTPEPFRGRPNKSTYIEHIVRRMAVLKGMEFEDCADALLRNGKHFFGV